MKQPDDKTSIRQMLDYAQSAREKIKGRSADDIASDADLRDILVRRLEVLGEAANRVSKDLKARHSEIPWPEIIGMRNRLIHAYDQVDPEHVWDVLTDDLPALIGGLERILAELS